MALVELDDVIKWLRTNGDNFVDSWGFRNFGLEEALRTHFDVKE